MSNARPAVLAWHAVVAAASCLVLAAGAFAATALRGETSNGVAVKLKLNASGVPTSFAVAGTTVTCKNGDLDVGKLRVSPLGDADSTSFAAQARDTSEDGAITFRSKTKLTGIAEPAGWSGTYGRKTKVFERGDRIDLCVVDATWAAS